jgi:hypothetical protein
MPPFSTVAGRLASRIPSGLLAISLTAVLGGLAAVALAPASKGARAAPGPLRFPDPARFILNALLVPALDIDAVPLRWVDPRAAGGCAEGTAVWVDGEPLRAGEPVPERPFDLRWYARGCRPLGAIGPRFDGTVTLRVHREDWGFSAYAWPEDLVVTTHLGARIRLAPGPAAIPWFPDLDEGLEPALPPPGLSGD